MSYPLPPDPVLVSEMNDGNEIHQFWWLGFPGERGARVITTDQYGARWTLDVNTTHLVTQKVAAGLLSVSLMTVNKWVRDEVFGEQQWRDGGVSVIPLRAVEALAVARGILPQ